MKKLTLAMACAALSSTVPSCISSTIAAATGASALGEASGLNSLGIASLFNSSAPESLCGRVITFDGDCRGIDNKEQKVNDAFSFNKNGVSIRTIGGVSQSLAYARKNDKSATIIGTGNGTETYRLTFTSGTEGSYTYERRGNAGDFATGEGTFSIK